MPTTSKTHQLKTSKPHLPTFLCQFVSIVTGIHSWHKLCLCSKRTAAAYTPHTPLHLIIYMVCQTARPQPRVIK